MSSCYRHTQVRIPVMSASECLRHVSRPVNFAFIVVVVERIALDGIITLEGRHGQPGATTLSAQVFPAGRDTFVFIVFINLRDVTCIERMVKGMTRALCRFQVL